MKKVKILFFICSDARLIDELHQNNKNTEDDDDDGSDSGGDEDGEDVEVVEIDLGDEGDKIICHKLLRVCQPIGWYTLKVKFFSGNRGH